MTTLQGNFTDLSANFIPDVWLNWVNDRITQTHAFFRSGIISNDPILGQSLLGQGYYVTIPHTQHIDTSLVPQDWNNKNDITTNGMTSFTENDVKIYEAQSFGNSDFDDLISGAKTLEQISAQFADYWGDIDEKRAIQVLTIAFLNADIAAAKSYGVGKEAEFKAEDFVKAMARMGDVNQGKPTTMAINSATYNYMLQQNIITFEQPSEGAMPIPDYNGLHIVQDDQVPLDSKGKTVAYIYAPGAMNYSVATAPNGVSTDRDNNKQGGITAITHKRIVTVHVAGTAADMAVHSDPTTWKKAIEAGTEALYKPVNDVRDIHAIEYGFTIDPDFVIPGVNTTDKPAATGTTDSGSSSTTGTAKAGTATAK